MVRTCLALLLLLAVTGTLFAQRTGDTFAVSVRRGELRSAPGFLSRIDAQVEYGDAVTFVVGRGDWYLVRIADTDIEGWIHKTSVLPPRELNLTGGDGRQTATTSREIALAGRGFSERIEQEYQEQQQLDFALVDLVESYLLQPPEIGEFLEDIGATIVGGGE